MSPGRRFEMRLLFVADGRSPTAINWIRAFADQGHEVHLASTFPCEPDFHLASLRYFPVAFSGIRSARLTSSMKKTIGAAGRIGLQMWLRHWLGPWTVGFSAGNLRKWIVSVNPDLVHAMRIPFEGMLAAYAKPACPLLISVWGNDFSLHAPATPWMRFSTRGTLRRASALHVDCYRDQRWALEWGLPSDRPILVLPGGGGVRGEFFYPKRARNGSARDEDLPWMRALPREAPVVVNARGFRAYVRNDTFFKAIPRILSHRPETVFLCPTMAGEPQAEIWLDRLAIRDSVRLLPKLTPLEMGALFRRALVTVSITEHDGTPNSLLEAMACGSLPVVGDLESIREWIEDGVNGMLVRPDDADELASAVLQAMADQALQQRAMLHNIRLIEMRASHAKVMREAEAFYRELIL
jgi:glycosyltransferase involved in cell wall biosynthesis